MEIKVKNKERITDPSQVAKVFLSILNSESEIDREKEHFWVMGLDSTKRIKYIELVTLGILNESLVHPREVFRFAILKGVDCIIICHNHPSGEVEPSSQDIKITEKLREAGNIIGIEVIDHLIIGENGRYLSFVEKNL
ncbi:MAG TPA: DNA repair protein RadC [Candidatus Omnitrophica bacterium]|nr:DNA repair protein RadC [Candidatus Omnitrophota bacterium]